jgi:hypothetical protein
MSRCLSVVMSACLAAAVLAAPVADEKKPAAADAERLVRQLGSSRFSDRESATVALDALGAAALPALREGAKSTDPEIRRRAGDMLAKLDRAAGSAAALTPTKVHLKATDAPLAEVVRDLGKQANVRFQLAREPVDLAGRRVTLDTGEVSFWEGLEALCRTAKVSLRPSTLDPAADDSAGGAVVINSGFGALPAGAIIAPNGAVMFNSVASPADEPMILQDGLLPVCPTAVLGAVRVRLIPDRWTNRDRKPGDEVKWTLEILTEPRVRWVGAPSFRFDSRPGLRVDSTPHARDGGTIPPGNQRIVLGGANMARSNGMGVTRYELPVYLKADAATAIGELKGSLAGPVQAPAGAVATIADVTKEKATATTNDGVKVTVREYSKADDGVVTMTLDLERPQAGIGGIAVGGIAGGGVINRIGRAAGGMIPPNIARMVAGSDGPLQSIKMFDAKGKAYEVAVTKSEIANRNGAMTGTLTLECQPPAADAKPGKLEVHGPRSMNVEAAFTLRGVPAVQ